MPRPVPKESVAAAEIMAEYSPPAATEASPRTWTRVVIQHQSGSRATQIEHFALDGVDELTMGRDPSCTIMFDSKRDDTVSRRHAVIRITNGDRLGFLIADLGSSNGTLVNGKRINSATELLPGDTVQMGTKGPSFLFDAQPRPAHLIGRTRINLEPAPDRNI